jgi:hypothetical protein
MKKSSKLTTKCAYREIGVQLVVNSDTNQRRTMLLLTIIIALGTAILVGFELAKISPG